MFFLLKTTATAATIFVQSASHYKRVRQPGLLEPGIGHHHVTELQNAAAVGPEELDVRGGSAGEERRDVHFAIDERLSAVGLGKRFKDVLRVQAGFVVVEELAEFVHKVVGRVYGI